MAYFNGNKVMNATLHITEPPVEGLKQTATGNPAVLDYVHPTEHVMDVRLENRNLATAQQVYEGNTSYAVMEYNGRQCVRFVDNTTVQTTPVSFKEKTQYTVSFDAMVVTRENLSVGNSGIFCFLYDDGTKTWIASAPIEEWQHFSATSTAGKTVVSIGTGSWGYVNYNYVDVDSFQLEESPTATPYTPHIADFSAVMSRNLIPYPYAETTKTENGITFTDNGDGTVTANGTATANAFFAYASISQYVTLPPGKYVVSGGISGNIFIQVKNTDTDADLAYANGNNNVFTLTETTNIRGNLYITSGTTVDNVVFKPQLEYGTTATPYVPYGAKPVTLTRYGRNLFDIGTSEDYSDYGSTFTGTIVDSTLTKPSLAGAASRMYNLTNHYKPGTYTVSAAFSEGASPRILCRCYDGSGNILTSSDITLSTGTYNQYYQGWHINNSTATLVIPDAVAYWVVGFVFYYSDDNEDVVTISNIQVELGTEATPYEPYVGTKHTANADGTVPGVLSVSPVTTLLTDTDGVIVSAGYYLDAASKIADLEETVLTLGGDV